MKLRPIKDETSYEKDIESGAIINTNRAEIETAKRRKQRFQEEKSRLDKIETDISDIRDLLLKLMEK